MRVFNFISLALAVFFSAAAHAAPMPLTSSSAFISAEKGLFHSASGFVISSGPTDWHQISPPKNNSYIETVYRAPEHAGSDSKSQAALTVRAEPLQRPTSLDDFANKWLKDYPRLGFEILTAKKVKVNDQIAFMLDLVSRENSKQLRQVIFVKGKNAVTITCRDDVATFAQSLKSCNEITRTFRW